MWFLNTNFPTELPFFRRKNIRFYLAIFMRNGTLHLSFINIVNNNILHIVNNEIISFCIWIYCPVKIPMIIISYWHKFPVKNGIVSRERVIKIDESFSILFD